MHESHSEKVRRIRDEWLNAPGWERTVTITHTGGILPVLVRFIEAGRVVSSHSGKNETDALAQAGMLLMNGGFESGGYNATAAE